MSLYTRRTIIILHDICMVALAWVLAIIIRYKWPVFPELEPLLWKTLPIVIIVQSTILWFGGLYQGVWRFASLPDLFSILRTVLLGTIAIVLVMVLFYRFALIPRSTLLFYPLLLIFLLGMPRLLYRVWCESSFNFFTPKYPKRVLLLGAGTSGDSLAREMLRRNSGCRDYMPIGFLDDNPGMQGRKVQGVSVLGSIDKLVKTVESMQVDMIIIAIPEATNEQMRQIVELCEQCSVPVRTLPKLEQIVNGQITLGALQEITLEDLLGRAKIQLDWQIIEAGLRDKIVMVTGGGGSIGAELCRQIAQLNPAALVIFERSEFNLYQIEMQLRQTFPDLRLHAHLGDIVDAVAVDHILDKYHPELIFHAAAYKHVPMLQAQAREAARNNILGTKLLAEAAAAHGCKKFVMVSTDKAVNPTNIMGATKRSAEIFCQAMNLRTKTNFITVRFGNVLGSAGSVIPLFKEQIAKGGPITVTHPDISRYFMTIPEACELILQSSAMGQGGEIFVLDMGKPVKIKYLAEQVIRLSGKIPEQDIKIVYTGLRPGEKLHEELFHTEEKLRNTTHAKILLANHRSNNWEQLLENLNQLTVACNNYAESDIKTLVKTLVPELSENPSIDAPRRVKRGRGASVKAFPSRSLATRTTGTLNPAY